MSDNPQTSDFLYGVPAIAVYLNLKERQVYHLADKNNLPVFKLGGKTCARKSSLQKWLESQEGGTNE